jgi:hypothetical protein
MTRLELYEKEIELNKGYQAQLHELRMEYAQLNKEFEVGDFIKNISGKTIIKIEVIKYLDSQGIISIMYCGYPHIFLRGQLLQNEYQEMTCFTNNIEKIEL